MRLERLTLEGALPTRNVLERTHWSRRRKMRADLRWRVIAAWNRRPRFEVPVAVRIVFHLPRLVDADNLDCKDLLDALKGIAFPDDGPRWIPRRPELSQVKAGRLAARIEVELEALAPEPGAVSKSHPGQP